MKLLRLHHSYLIELTSKPTTLRAQDIQKQKVNQKEQNPHLKADEIDTNELSDSEVAQKVDELLREKAKLLHEYGVFTWKKSVRRKHREINEELEALGVFQGRKCFRQKKHRSMLLSTFYLILSTFC